MRHRAAVRADRAPLPARNPDEARLEQLQTALTNAEADVRKLAAERDALALHLWLDRRVPQAEIAVRLDRADRAAGGEGVSYAAVQKRLFRERGRFPMLRVAN